MDSPLRLRLQLLGVRGSRVPSSLYAKFEWRNRKHKSGFLTSSGGSQTQGAGASVFVLPFDPQRDGTRIRLRLWRHRLLQRREVAVCEVLLPSSPGDAEQICLPIEAFGENGEIRLSVQLLEFDALRSSQQLQHRLGLQREAAHREEMQRAHESQLAVQEFQRDSGLPEQSLQQVMAVLPHVPPHEAALALKCTNGSPEAAIDLLLRGAGSAGGFSQTTSASQGYPQMTPYGNPPPFSQGGFVAPSPIATHVSAPPRPGRRKALLIGINYKGTSAALKGCVLDVERMKHLLCSLFGFYDSGTEMVVLRDDATNPIFQPTRANILEAMRWLTAGALPGDAFFFHFSGHGSRQRDKSGVETDGFDETILPVDFRTAGHIIDDEMHYRLVQPLQSGCRLTAVMDCCHSGTGLDLPYIWNPTEFEWREELNPFFVPADVQLFSGCEDDQTSADVRGEALKTASGGAMTTAFVSVLTQNPSAHSYPSLLQSLHNNLEARGFRQRPQLTSSQKFSFQRNFSLTDAMPNSNPSLGRRIRRLRKPLRERDKAVAALVLGSVAATVAGIALSSALD